MGRRCQGCMFGFTQNVMHQPVSTTPSHTQSNQWQMFGYDEIRKKETWPQKQRLHWR